MTALELERQERLQVTASDGTTHRFYTHDELQAAIEVKNAQIIDLIEALRKRSNGELCGCGVDNPTDVCLSHYDVIEAVVRNRVQAAIAAAMMGAVKPLEWEEDVDYRGNRIWKAVSPITGEKYWSLDGAGYREYQDKEHAARILSALSIPTDATAALDAMIAEAEQRGFDRAKDQAAEHLYQLMMDNSDEALQAQIDCLLADMTLEGSPNLAAYFRDKLIASIPTDAATTLSQEK